MRNSKIILAKDIKLDRNYKNVLNYTESQMLALVNANKIGESNFNSFIRQNGNSIATNFNYNQALQANYIAFQNPDYSNKWFFAWIDEIVYKNDANIEIYYTIDAWSTWFDKLNLANCFIVREHVSDDTIGLHTIPEGLDVGEVIQEGDAIENNGYYRTQGYYVAVLSDWTINDNSSSSVLPGDAQGHQFDGVAVYDSTVFGSELFIFPINSLADFNNLRYFIIRTNLDGHVNDIHNMFIVPKNGIDETNLVSHQAKLTSSWISGGADTTFYWKTIQKNSTPESFISTIAKPYSFTNLNIANNKCYCYPYNYLFVTNNNGSSNIYKYEDFSTEDVNFINLYSLTIGGSGRLLPMQYKGMNTDDEESLPLGKHPTCAWSSDAFTNWLTQNSVNIATQMATTGAGLVLAGATGGASIPAMAAISSMSNNEQSKAMSQYTGAINTAGQIAGLIGQFYQASLLPNIQGGQATGDVVWASDRNCFTFRKMRAKDEYMKILDSYFTRFGYKTNRLGTPNITCRAYWNYLEIGQGEQVGFGEIPSIYLDVMNRACQSGVTIWHNHTNIGNYELSNTIVAN